MKIPSYQRSDPLTIEGQIRTRILINIQLTPINKATRGNWYENIGEDRL